jgi:hypothetical protein
MTMSDEIPQINDRVRVCYNKNPHHGKEGRIVALDEHCEEITILLNDGNKTQVGCDDYEYLGKGIPSTKCLGPLQRKLKELGFDRKYLERSVYNGVTQIYRKEIPETGVALEVQLRVHYGWAGEKPSDKIVEDHRMSHFHKGETTGIPYAVMNTRPTGFSSVEGMVKAIDFESTRHAKGVGKTVQKDFK